MGGVGPLIKCLSYRSYPQTPEPNGSQQSGKARAAPPGTQRERGRCVYERRGGQPPQWTRRRRLKARRPVICPGAKNYVAKTHQLRGLRAENGSLSSHFSVYTHASIAFQLTSSLWGVPSESIKTPERGLRRRSRK